MLIDWFTIIAQLINFLVLIWLLKRYLYKPILDAIDEREKKIELKLSSAEKIQNESKEASIKLDEQLQNIEAKRSSIISKAEKEAHEEYERLLVESKQKIEDLRLKEREKFRNEQKELSDKLRLRIQKEVFRLSKKVLVDLTDTSLESELIKQFIIKLNKLDKKLLAREKLSPKYGVIKSSFELSTKQKDEILNAIVAFFENKIDIEYKSEEGFSFGIDFTVDGYKIVWSIENQFSIFEENLMKLHHKQKIIN